MSERMAPLQMPSFLRGSFTEVQKKARSEGLACAVQYRKGGTVPVPRELWEVPSGEPILAHEVVDLQHERPAWRLYMLSQVIESLCEELEWQNLFQVGDLFEEAYQETAWGALYFAISQTAPRSAARMARRLRALLRFWEPLQSARYVFSAPGVALDLEELMMTARQWVMDAWAPVGEGSVHVQLALAAERMARATKEESLDAILRQLPRALASAQGLKHRDVLADPATLRARLEALPPRAFERVSGACTSDLLSQLYAWDQQLEKQ